MSYIIPNGTMILCGDVGIDPNYENTGYFANATQQYNYFYSKKIQEFTGLSYQRVDKKTIRVNAHYPIVYQSNYMMFKNTEFHENKWFYAFVTKISYINDNCCEITYELDVIQTWYFETHFGQCLIERNTVPTSEDIIGDNIQDEGLETGEYFETFKKFLVDHSSYTYVLVCNVAYNGKLDPETGSPIWENEYEGDFIGDYFSGCKVYTYTSNTKLLKDIKDIGESGKGDSIVSLYMLPSQMCLVDEPATSMRQDITIGTKAGLRADPTLFEGYVPRNKKLYTYPYCFLYGSNLSGVSAVYPIEYFNTDTISFECLFDYSPNAVFIARPNHYRGQTLRSEHMLQTSGFPQCSANIDTYKAWLAQNTNSLNAQSQVAGMKFIEGALIGANGLRTGTVTAIGVGASTMVNAIESAITLDAKKNDIAIKPPSVVGSFNPTNITQLNHSLINIDFSLKYIQRQYAKKIDDFFTMYGYAIGYVETPRIHNRSEWTYIKTCGCIIHGNAPADDIAKMEAIHDQGIRYWTNLNNVGNFSLPNV